MKRNEFIKYCLTSAIVAYFPIKLFAGKTNELPNVLLIGDSISIGYTPFVQVDISVMLTPHFGDIDPLTEMVQRTDSMTILHLFS